MSGGRDTQNAQARTEEEAKEARGATVGVETPRCVRRVAHELVGTALRWRQARAAASAHADEGWRTSARRAATHPHKLLMHLAATYGAALHGREGVAAALLRLCAGGETQNASAGAK